MIESEDSKHEPKWVLTRNGIEKEFQDFKTAKKAFRDSTIDAISDEDAYVDGEPFSVGVYFSGKYDGGYVSDEEIVIEARARTLLQYLLYPTESEKLKAKILRTIPKDYSYRGVDEFDVEVAISIKKSLDEIAIRLEANDNGVINRLETNAFVCDDESKEYFFVANEMISTSSDSRKLGKTIYSNIALRKAERG